MTMNRTLTNWPEFDTQIFLSCSGTQHLAEQTDVRHVAHLSTPVILYHR